MAPPGRLANAGDIGSLQSWARELRARIAGMSRPPMVRASFDAVRVEAELYDALYGRRTGTVDNIVPVSADAAARKQTGVVSATSSTPPASGERRETRRDARDTHKQDLRHAA